jgi:zinc protease
MNFRFRTNVSAFFTFLMICTMFVSSISAQAKLPDGVQKITTIEGITEYRLANGLQVLLFPDQTKQNITVNIIYKVGSRHESYGETGMAHLLEHLVFKGTPKHQNIPAELTSHGASPNGTTWYDRTNYFETFAATDENLNWALDLESDRMVNSYIARKDLDSEFSVVRNEMESGENDAAGILIEKIMATAYQWHNYGKDTIGARSDVENVKIENLQAFYRKYYQPDNAVLVVAGKIDEAKTLNLINQKFGSIPKPTRVIEKNWTIEPTQDGERQVTIRRVGDSQYAMAGYHIPPTSHADFPAVLIMSRILVDTPSGRLYKNLVETKKASSIFSQILQNKEPSYAIFGAELGKDASIDAARDALLQTIENFAQTPPSKEEVERFKAAALKNIELSFNEPNSIALQMVNWVAVGDWKLLFLYRDRLKKVTPEDVQRVAQKYLLQSNRTLGIFVPTEKPVRAEIPKVSDEEIATMTKDVKGGEALAAGEVFDPTPTNIESRTKRGQIGGIKTAFLSKKNRGESVVLRLNLRMGDAKSLKNRGDAGDFAGRLLMRGTVNKTRQQIKDEFDRLKAQGGVAGGATSVGSTITTNRKNLPEVLKLVAEILKEPAFSQAEFDQLKTETLTNLENERSEPQSIAIRAMSQAFNKYPKGDIRYSGTLDEEIADIKALTLDNVKKFYKDFYGASTGELAVVGDFDEKEITDLVTQLFGNWKSPKAFQRIPSEYFDIPAVNQTFETPDKANAVFLARMNVKMRDDNPDYAAFTLGNFMLGGGFLNSRLATRIRQKEGLSYGVGSNFNASSLDESGSFFANAIYAPQNVDKLEAAFKEELQKVITEGFTDAEVAEAKKGWLLNRTRNRGQDNGIAMSLANYLFSSRTFAWDDAIEKKVNSLTTAEINAAMKKFLTPDKVSIFKAGDFANAKNKMTKPQ